MKLHYEKTFNGDVATLPQREHAPGAVKFREPESPARMALIANGGALVLMVLTFVGMFWRIFHARELVLDNFPMQFIIGSLLVLITLFPHELLHASCFRGDVYLYTYLKKGMLFVVGPEDMSRGRFVFMSMLPNLVFGFVPYILFLIHPAWLWLGVFGAMAIPSGFGDYFNVFNCLTQVPKGGIVYLSGFNSYWYMPETK
ncbi:MAG: DUF3267 domain-containing protein [Oscillospiraceae bacterium]|nr:DUF3267 domain-containing protein [Oscillospiraceae bacterium]